MRVKGQTFVPISYTEGQRFVFITLINALLQGMRIFLHGKEWFTPANDFGNKKIRYCILLKMLLTQNSKTYTKGNNLLLPKARRCIKIALSHRCKDSAIAPRVQQTAPETTVMSFSESRLLKRNGNWKSGLFFKYNQSSEKMQHVQGLTNNFLFPVVALRPPVQIPGCSLRPISCHIIKCLLFNISVFY